MMVCCSPEQLRPAFKYCGVTVTVDTTALLLLLTAVKLEMFPVPTLPSPMLASVFVQE